MSTALAEKLSVMPSTPARPAIQRLQSAASADSAAAVSGAAERLKAENVDFYYGRKQVLHGISLSIPGNRITALIGPSGCGKTTFLRMINRMCDVVEGTRYGGRILLDGANVLDSSVDVVELRRKAGMVFQKPNPFPKSIYDNVAYGVRLYEKKSQADLDVLVESSLRKAALWDEVKDHLHTPGTALSGGQQQRLCIARTLAVSPDILLMDEPTSALDPIATSKIETLLAELAAAYTIIIVTHNMQQAARISHETAFFFMGKLVEAGPTERIFTMPKERQTEDYVTGRFG